MTDALFGGRGWQITDPAWMTFSARRNWGALIGWSGAQTEYDSGSAQPYYAAPSPN